MMHWSGIKVAAQAKAHHDDSMPGEAKAHHNDSNPGQAKAHHSNSMPGEVQAQAARILGCRSQVFSQDDCQDPMAMSAGLMMFQRLRSFEGLLHLMMQELITGCTEVGPDMWTASRKPVMSMSMLRMTQLLDIRKVGLLALWSIFVSPKRPDPSMSRRLVTFTASLHPSAVGIQWPIIQHVVPSVIIAACNVVASLAAVGCCKLYSSAAIALTLAGMPCKIRLLPWDSQASIHSPILSPPRLVACMLMRPVWTCTT